MTRKSSESQLKAAIEKLTEQMSVLAEELHVLRDAIDDVRGEWLTRNADPFQPHVVHETAPCPPNF